jgi:hypothetical protein
VIFWPALIVPIVIAAAVAVAIVEGIFDPTKQFLETIGFVVPTAAALLAFGRAAATREPFLLWLAVLCANFAIRELDPPGYTHAVYWVLGLLGVAAWWWRAKLAGALTDRTVLTLLACTGFTYSLAVALDLRWLKFIPHEEVFEVLLEETMEIVGHCWLLALACGGDRPDKPWRPRRKERHSARELQ